MLRVLESRALLAFKTDVKTVRTSGGTRRRLARLGRGREKQAPW